MKKTNIKNIILSKGGWAGFAFTLAILFLTARFNIPLLESIIQNISRFLINIVCPTGGLECLGWGIPLILFYALIGFAIGHLIENHSKQESVKNHRKI